MFDSRSKHRTRLSFVSYVLVILSHSARGLVASPLVGLSFYNLLSDTTMGNTVQGAMAVSKAKNFASDAGLSMGDDKKDDAKINAKVAKKQAELEEAKKKRMTKDEELAQRKKERAARKAELEKARGFR